MTRDRNFKGDNLKQYLMYKYNILVPSKTFRILTNDKYLFLALSPMIFDNNDSVAKSNNDSPDQPARPSSKSRGSRYANLKIT